MKGKKGEAEERLDVSSVFPFAFAVKIYRFGCRYECLYGIRRRLEVVGSGRRVQAPDCQLRDCKKSGKFQARFFILSVNVAGMKIQCRLESEKNKKKAEMQEGKEC